jgi:hypothetical protein
LNLALDLAWALAYFALGAIIAWRKFGDWWTLLVSFWMILQGTSTISLVVGEGASIWQYPALIENTFAFVFLWLVFLLFPDGRFIPRWTRWAFGGLLVLALLYLFLPEVAVLQLLFNFGGVFCVIAAQIYRYRRSATPVQRQQTKWVVYAIVSVTLADLAVQLPTFFLSQSTAFGFVYAYLADTLVTCLTLFIPIAFVIAMLRYRLWDTDILINKTLVYGGLSVLLAGIYAGLIIGLESLVGAITGTANQPVTLVVSTLTSFALVTPVRRRIQALIDRYFYRKMYDAEQTLAAFSVTLQSEVDLIELRAHLLSAVNETMQPVHGSLWLRSPERRSTEQAQRLELQAEEQGRPTLG